MSHYYRIIFGTPLSYILLDMVKKGSRSVMVNLGYFQKICVEIIATKLPNISIIIRRL